jgi:catechol 2,3-dioxygenase-like lactoylglutathione lyase family enzyme
LWKQRSQSGAAPDRGRSPDDGGVAVDGAPGPSEVPAKDSLRVAQLDHVELFVPDRQAAAAWYARTLGLQVDPQFETWAADPQGPLMIATAAAGTKLALFAGEPQAYPASGFHRVAFRVSRRDFEAFLAHVRVNPVFGEQGEEVRELTVRNHGAALSVYFRDPYGHLLEVTTYDVVPERP